MLSSAIEIKISTVSADGTQNIPPSAIPNRLAKLPQKVMPAKERNLFLPMI
jgi:hypothetical protein